MTEQDLKDLEHSIERLAHSNERLIRRHTYLRHFMYGILSGVGATAGAALVIALLVWLLHALSGFDYFKPAVNNLLPYVEQQGASRINRFTQPTYSSATPTPSTDASPNPSPSSETSS